MRTCSLLVKTFFLSALWLSTSFVFATDSDSSLTEALKDFQSLERELAAILKLKTPECLPNPNAEAGANFCSLKSYCLMPALNKDAPIIYKNAKGESIQNDQYYNVRDGINACLREKYADEIKEKKGEMTQRLGLLHLQKIMTANKKLVALTAKHKQGSALQRISAEILNLSIEAGLNDEPAVFGQAGVSGDELMSVVSLAEKRLKLKLHPDLKKTLVEIEYLKNNPLYLAEVEQFEKDLIPLETSADPFFEWSLLTSVKAAKGELALARNREALRKKAQEAYELFLETKEEMYAYLNEQKNDKNKLQIERIIERVKSTKFTPPRLTAELKEHCKYPNAFYNPRKHALTICPQYLNYPKMALKETMAHELAHSFDSCNLSGYLMKTKGPEVIEEAPFDIEIKMSSSSPGNLSNPRGDFPEGVNPKNKIQDKMLYADHPFTKTMSCLEDSRSVGAIVSNVEGLRKKAESKLHELTLRNENVPNNPQARILNYFLKNEAEYFSYFKGCDTSYFGDTLGRSQMQEAFADKMASEIVARAMKKMPQDEARNAVLEIALSYGNVCPNQTPSELKLRDFAIKNGCTTYNENLSNQDRILNTINQIDPAFDSHPETQKRLEKSLLAHPAIRKTLNCPKDRGVKYCE